MAIQDTFAEFTTPEHFDNRRNEISSQIDNLHSYMNWLWYWDKDPMRLTLLQKSDSELTPEDLQQIELNSRHAPGSWNINLNQARARYKDFLKTKKQLEWQLKKVDKAQNQYFKDEMLNAAGIQPGEPAVAGWWASNTSNDSWALWAVDQSIQSINSNADNQLQWAAMDAANKWGYLKWLSTRTGSSMWEAWANADSQNAAFRQQAAWINAWRNSALTAAYNNKSKAIQNLMQQRTDRMQAAQKQAPVFNSKNIPVSKTPTSPLWTSTIDLGNWDNNTSWTGNAA